MPSPPFFEEGKPERKGVNTNMKNKKVFSAIATAALLFNSVGAVFAETTSLVITGNGSGSTNTTTVAVQNATQVVQENTANITNSVNADSSTGSNSANRNTSGAVAIDTGNASTGVAVSNTANSNVAHVDGCCETDASVEISGNGEGSDNDADLTLGTSTGLYQINNADIRNTVNADSSSGNNDAGRNTGGDVTITTGNAETAVLVENTANSNFATLGDGEGAGSVSLRILENGSGSTNDIDLALGHSLELIQDNDASIRNNVDADSETGENDANRNTGGEVMVDTGNASTGVGIDNMANFNFADLDCGCLMEVLAKVAGNGEETENTIEAELVDARAAFQTNDYSCKEYEARGFDFMGGRHGRACNDVDADAESGENEVERSTGDHEGDPSIETGDADTLVDMSTTANSNVLTDGDELELPEFDFDFDFGSNWEFLMAWFHGSSM